MSTAYRRVYISTYKMSSSQKRNKKKAVGRKGAWKWFIACMDDGSWKTYYSKVQLHKQLAGVWVSSTNKPLNTHLSVVNKYTDIAIT